MYVWMCVFVYIYTYTCMYIYSYIEDISELIPTDTSMR
jgi:hypothetical protein